VTLATCFAKRQYYFRLDSLALLENGAQAPRYGEIARNSKLADLFARQSERFFFSGIRRRTGRHFPAQPNKMNGDECFCV
jgi:hypothetical protein